MEGNLMDYEVTKLPTIQEPQPESLLGQATRIGTGALFSGLGTIAQIPTSIFDLGLAINQATLPAGIPKLSPEQRAGLEIGPKVRPFIEEQAEKVLPKDYLKPKNIFERKIQDLAAAVPAFFRGNIKEAAILALGSEGGKEIAKQMGYDEFGQFIGSIGGATLAAGLTTPAKLKNLAKLGYKSFEQSIPKDAKQTTQFTQQALNAVEDLDLLPDDLEFVQKSVMKRIQPWVQKGNVGIQQAWKDKKYINELIRESKPSNKLRRALSAVSNGITKDIVSAQQQIPALNANALLEADSIYTGLQNLSPIRRFLRKYITPENLVKVGAAETFGQQAFKELTPGLLAKPFALGVGARALTEAIEPILKSPIAAREILGTTIPQIAGGTLLTRPQTKLATGDFEITKLPS